MTRSAAAVLFWLATAPAPDPAAPDASGGPVVIVTLAVITLAGTALTAFAPAIQERIRGAPPAPAPTSGDSPPAPAPPPTPESNQMVRSGHEGLSMVEAAVLDYRSQRDAAMLRYDAVLEDLEEARDIIREQAVYIAQLETHNGRSPNYGGRHAPFPNNPQNRNRP